MTRLAAALATTLVVALTTVAAAGQAAGAAVPVNTAPPTITGTTTVGQTLTATDGSWSNSPTSFTYQWRRCNGGGNNCASIPNATGKTYALVAADAGHAIRVRVTASNADGASAPAESAATAAVAPAASNAVPKNTALPTISGTARVGQTLTAAPGSWSGNPTAFAYQWQHCQADVVSCADIAGATARTFLLHGVDVGYRMRVKVTAKNDKGSATAASALSAIVAPAATITNKRPTLVILSVRFLGQVVYARFRICDDAPKNLTIIETDSRPGKLSYTRRFTTLVPPRPCGVYTRHWTPAPRFRGPGRFTITLRARDKSGLTSLPARRTFNHG